ncbi:hypothetical protein D3C73_572530 [compost metagenome]
MKPETVRLLNLVQIISEVAIAAGYLLGMIPFVYLWSCAWVIPLVFVNLIIALINRNNTMTFTIVNIVLAFLSFIPILGYLFRAGGIVVSWINIRALQRGRGSY